jgi:hypothetical protein
VVIEIALGIVVEAIISTLASSSTERMTGGLISKLKGDPSKKAFKGALALAIRHYSSSASGQRKLFARALMEENGFLTSPSVIAEVSKLVKFKDPPDAQIVGKHWKESLDYQPIYINFTDEAQLLLNYIKSELEESEVFRPVFQAKSLDNIATSTAL